MTTASFLYCRDCDALFRPSPYDRAPEFRMTVDGYEEIARDDYGRFLTVHARHRLRSLRPMGDQPFHDGSAGDPMRQIFWQVMQGGEPYVVEGKREHIAEPLAYRLRPGRLTVDHFGVEIPEDELRARIDHALFPGVVPERKLAAVVAACKAVIWALDPTSLEILYELPGDPTLCVATLPATALARIGEEARRIFDEAEAARIQISLTATAADADAFTVLVRRRMRTLPQ